MSDSENVNSEAENSSEVVADSSAAEQKPTLRARISAWLAERPLSSVVVASVLALLLGVGIGQALDRKHDRGPFGQEQHQSGYGFDRDGHGGGYGPDGRPDGDRFGPNMGPNIGPNMGPGFGPQMGPGAGGPNDDDFGPNGQPPTAPGTVTLPSPSATPN